MPAACAPAAATNPIAPKLASVASTTSATAMEYATGGLSVTERVNATLVLPGWIAPPHALEGQRRRAPATDYATPARSRVPARSSFQDQSATSRALATHQPFAPTTVPAHGGRRTMAHARATLATRASIAVMSVQVG